jgi:hypothetical protein
VLVYVIEPGQSISKSTLESLQKQKLDKDDVLQRPFYKNVIFYGADEHDVDIEPDALRTLADWNTKFWTFIKGSPEDNARTGPYVYARGRTWQPWRVYRDFNGIFMSTFKPSIGGKRYV